MNIKLAITALVLSSCFSSFGLRAAEHSLTSPGGEYTFRLWDGEGGVFYTVDWNGLRVVLPSRIGIGTDGAWGGAVEATSDGGSWGGAITLAAEAIRGSRDAVWNPVYGERSEVVDRYTAMSVALVHPTNPRARLQLDVRAYDTGVAFRYSFTGGEYLHIVDEHTTFRLPEGTQAYFTPTAQKRYTLMPLADWPGESERPLVCVLPDGNGHLLLTEAGVVDYVRTKFRLDERTPGTLACAMYGPADVIAPYSTPWRVIMAATEPGELIENNDLILNLNPPTEIADPRWIEPGKVMREVTLTTQGAKDVVDFCVRRNLQYVMFDAGWYGPEGSKASDATTVTLDPARNPNTTALDLPGVIAYARSKGIGVILYVNQRALAQQLDEILPLYREWGVKGIKFGFVQVGSQYWTAWMHNAVKKCAEYGIMVDIHDEYRPTGFSRTYPNLMTQEGIYGNEEFPDATTNVTLPFTRFTQGAADYTICYYRRDWTGSLRPDTAHGLVNARFIKTTPAHQLALAAIYYSPLQLLYWYDKPTDYRDELELSFWDAIPTVWDDTRVVQGAIGEYITVARRSGREWFIGTITGNEGRSLTIPLDFLDPWKDYTAIIYEDDDRVETRTKVRVRSMAVDWETVLEVELKPSGGQAIRIMADGGGGAPGSGSAAVVFPEADLYEALDYSVRQAERTLAALPEGYDRFPQNIDGDSTEWRLMGPGGWTCGFWPGIAWYMWEVTGRREWLAAAEGFTASIVPVATGRARSHDVGFITTCSIGQGERLTGRRDYRTAMLQAADSLAVLYNRAAGTILSWPGMVERMGWRHNTIMDNMMNLELLFWASKNGGDPRLGEIARRHAEVTMQNQFRADGSTFHVAVYNHRSGKFLKGVTHQGYADTSMWARGQAWAIYGFTMSFRETGYERFLETARRAADIYLKRLPEDMIPYWDFDAPGIPDEPRDASAAAITASALLELSTLESDPVRAARYREAAERMLVTLSSHEYRGGEEGKPSMLVHSTGHRPNGSEVDAAIIYADYYYLEALIRLKRLREGRGVLDRLP